MKNLMLFCFGLCLIFIGSCAKQNGDPVAAFNANLELPQGSYQVNPDEMEVDNSITISSGSGGTTPINTGSQMTSQITFNAPNGNVVAGGMRFGNSGPVNVVPVSGAQGQTSGTLSLPFSVSASTCNNLSQVCHDIKCYEFAITADGKISQANLRDVALMCGGCDEPSCQSLINPPCPPSPGQGSFNSSIASGSGTGFCDQSGTMSISSSSSYSVSIVNMPTSGSNISIDASYYSGGSSSPAIQLNTPSGDAYIAVSGSASWNGNVFSFNVNIQTITDFVNGSSTTYALSGSISC